MPRVYNKKYAYPKDAVYIGRPSYFGNPFSHKPGTKAEFLVASREEAIAAYRVYLLSNPEMMRVVQAGLKGKDLVCWCAPLPCHGDVLLEIANAP